MRGSQFLRYAAVGLVALIGASACAQSAQDGSQAPASVTSEPTAKAIRAADRKLRKAVLRSLTRTKGLNADRIVVVAKGGLIWLEGYVNDTGQIQLATSAASGVTGVSTVNNRLIVRAEGL
ncbi:BON domain-containing protein [Paraburkholderia oxyphila]|uniref:BON domain-containing protein n=1 Tax=Paraburkholderia oxyphila TaxID=614212 RepID=UPI00048866B1|nr:BON domain-containing protein [Paraburkholderia oxyphila]